MLVAVRLAPIPFVKRLAMIAERSGPEACWDWPGFCFDGYGKVSANLDARGSRVWFAHLAAYTILVGPVPSHLELDHLCRNRRCMNPRHLEPVTPRVNTLRSNAPTAANARKTHCKHGHEFTPENTYDFTTKYGTPGRACVTCTIRGSLESEKRRRAADPEAFRAQQRDKMRRHRARRRAAAP